MVADLVNMDGSRAGYSTGSQLHHMVLFNQDAGRTDATCHTGVPFPLGALFVTYHWVQAPADISNLEPVWFDVAQCGFSTFTALPGPSSASWSWNVNRPGDIVGIGGHGHDGTINIVVKNDTTGQVICDSRAGYGESPLYIDPEHGDPHLSSMSTCIRAPVASVSNGQRVTMTANYIMAKQDDGQMGIVIAYVGQPRGGGGAACTTGTNDAHVAAGRATAFLLWVFAKGSNAYIGTTWESSSLREAPTGTFTKVTNC